MPAVIPTAISMEEVVLVILGKIYLLQNRIRKIELIQTVLIHKSHALLSETLTAHPYELMRRVSTLSIFTELTCHA